MFEKILLADRLDRLCNALDRIAEALDRAYPPEEGKLLVGHELIKTLGKEPLDVADNESTWLKELEDLVQEDRKSQKSPPNPPGT